MSKKYENSIWNLCLMNYSPDGNPKNMVTGYGVLFDIKNNDNKDAKSRLSSYNIFIPIETFISISSDNPRKYKNKYFYYYNCYFEISSKASRGRFFELADENMLTFNSLSELRKYIKGIEFYLISHSCKGMHFTEIYRGNITHTFSDNSKFIERDVPIISVPGGYWSIGEFFHKDNVLTYILYKLNPKVFPFSEIKKNTSGLTITSDHNGSKDTFRSNDILSGNTSEFISSLLSRSKKYLNSLVKRYNNSPYGSSDRKGYKYVLESYIGKRKTDKLLLNKIKYEVYTGRIISKGNGFDKISDSCYFIKMPGSNAYIKLFPYDFGIFTNHILANLSTSSSIPYYDKNLGIIKGLIMGTPIDDLSVESYEKNDLDDLLKVCDATGYHDLIRCCTSNINDVNISSQPDNPQTNSGYFRKKRPGKGKFDRF